MSPLRGRGGRDSQAPPQRSSAGGGDWAEDLDWVDPRLGEPAPRSAPGGLQGLLGRLTAGRRPPPTIAPPATPARTAPGTTATPTGTTATGATATHQPASGGAPPAGPAPRRRRRTRYLVRRLVALAVLACLGFVAWFLVSLFQPFAGGGGGGVTVSIPPDSSGSQVATLLANDGVVSSSFFFNLRASLDGDSNKFRAGVYTLKHGMSYAAALSALTHQQGGAAEISLTIPEGDTREQIALLARKAGLRGNYMQASTPKAAHFSPQAWGAHKSVRSLEGFLFPDTYYLYRHGWVSSLVQKQLAAFEQNFAQVKMRYARSKNLTRYDVITIASIIERESQLTTDGPKVAAVIYNRLAEGIPLGLDTTLIYYLEIHLHYPKGGVTTKQLDDALQNSDTPYNTRKHYGLPPTPIANPGLQALEQAATPAHVDYLYFVVKPNACGALAFTSNQTAFDDDVDAYNAAVKADHGRLPDACPSTKTK